MKELLTYHFADLQLDTGRHQLSRAGQPIKLTKLSFEVLQALVKASPNLLTHDELIDKVWGSGRVISAENLSQRVTLLRQSLGDEVQHPAYVETVYGQGFRLIPSVTRLTEKARDAENSALSIAVLPFVNMSDDAGNEYFSDGISEEVLNLLTKIPQLKVIARTSSFSFKGKDVSITEIANALNVTHVLEGSVRKSENQVRITTQLIRASDSSHLWSESYDRKLENIFQIQDEIATKLVAQLKIKLFGEVPKVQAIDPEAYALLLQARQMYNQGTREAMEQCIALMHKAAKIAPESSVVWGELARIFAALTVDFRRRESHAIQARDAARRALAINPDSAIAENALFIAARNADLDIAAATRHLERALALEPANPMFLRNAGELSSILGRLDDAIAIQEFVVSRDPAGPWGHLWLGSAYRAAGRLDKAIVSLRTALRLSPEFWMGRFFIGLALLQKGECEAALAAVNEESVEEWRLLGLAHVYHAVGNTAESDTALNELIANYGQQRPAGIAQVLASRGEFDRAFEWFKKGVKYRDFTLLFLGAAGGWGVAPVPAIQKDPRWLPLLESIGSSPAQLDAIEFKVTVPE